MDSRSDGLGDGAGLGGPDGVPHGEGIGQVGTSGDRSKDTHG